MTPPVVGGVVGDGVEGAGIGPVLVKKEKKMSRAVQGSSGLGKVYDFRAEN